MLNEERMKNLKTSAEKPILWKNDPLLYFFKEKLGFSSLRTVLCLITVSAIVLFGLGWIADSLYTGSGSGFKESQFCYFALVAVFLGGPVLFGFYVWQSGAFAQVLRSFEETHTIREASEKGRKHRIESYSDFLDKFQMAVDSKRWTIIAAILIVGYWMLEFLVVVPSSIAIRSSFFFEVKWFLVVLSLIASVWLYALFLISLKTVQVILYCSYLFQWFDVRVCPMHADGAGGLGALGNYTLNFSLVFVGFGAVNALTSIVLWLAGDDPFARPDQLFYWALYIVAIPVSLVLPMLSAHRAMQEAKNKKLNEIAQEFEQTLSDASVIKTNSTKALKEANEKLKELQTRYDIVTASLPTWPIPARLFRNFSITASLPLVSGLMPMAIDFAMK